MKSQANARKIIKLPCVNQVRVTKGNQYATIQKHDRVFVVPPGGSTHEQDFQIARVDEIRVGEKSGPWFHVQLYEGIREAPTNPSDLAPTELILQPEKYWLPFNVIIDNTRTYFQEFDDTIPDPPRMNSQIWFSRSKETRCTVCIEPYRPHKHRQRYCHSCQLWFHLQCLGDVVGDDSGDPTIDFHTPTTEETVDIEAVGEDGFPAIFNDIVQQPTVRGHGGEYDWDNNWLTTGSGVQKGLIARWREEDVCPDDWSELFGEDFLQDFIIEKRWKFYLCPRCACHV